MNLSKKTKEEKIVERVYDDFHYSAIARRNSMEQYVNAFKMYFNETISENEKAIIYNTKQSEVSLNYLRWFLRQLQAFLTANQPTWHAFAIGSDDNRKSQMARAVLSHTWRISKGYLRIAELIKRGIVGGVGLFSSFIDYRMDDGLGEVVWQALPLQYFYGDWRSQDELYEDMEFQQISMLITLSAARKFVPKSKWGQLARLVTADDEYAQLFSTTDFAVGEMDEPYSSSKVRIISDFRLEEADYWEVKDMVSDEVFSFESSPDFHLPAFFEKKKRSGRKLVRRDVITSGRGDGIVGRIQSFPSVDEFLCKPFIDERTGNMYGLGEAYFVVSLQKYIDKALRVALQHESLAANPGILIPKGSIEDRQGFMERVREPGFVEEFEAEYGQPYFKQPSPASSAFFQIYDLMLNAMRNAIPSSFGPGQGDPGQTHGNYREAALLKDSGQQQASLIYRSFEATLEAQGRATLKLAKGHYNYPKLFKFIDISRRRPATMLVNRAFVNEQNMIDAYSIDDIEHDVAIGTRSWAPTDRYMNIEVIERLIGSAPPEAVPLLFRHLAKYLELDPEMLDELDVLLDTVPKLLEQLQQLQQALQQAESEKKKLTGQVFTADRKALRADAEATLKKQVDKFVNELEKVKNEHKLNLKQKELATTRGNGKPERK